MPYLRIVYCKLDPAKLEVGITDFKEHAVPAARSWPGYVASELKVNRQTGASVTLTGWETLDAMNASDELAEEARRQAQETTGAVILDIDRGELFLSQGTGKAVSPLLVRWAEGYADLDKIDQMIGFVRTKIMTVVSALPAFVALNCVINRMTGRLWIVSSWGERRGPGGGGLRGRSTDSGGSLIGGVKHCRVTEYELAYFHGRTATGDRPE